MDSFLSREVLDGIARARGEDFKRKNRLRLKTGDEVLPVLRLWHDGFAMDATHRAHLRGLVDIYDGARHLSQCLIIHSEEEAGTVRYEFKRRTESHDTPPVDFEIAADAPAGLIGGPLR
jgi:hypothetical protein